MKNLFFTVSVLLLGAAAFNVITLRHQSVKTGYELEQLKVNIEETQKEIARCQSDVERLMALDRLAVISTKLNTGVGYPSEILVIKKEEFSDETVPAFVTIWRPGKKGAEGSFPAAVTSGR